MSLWWWFTNLNGMWLQRQELEAFKERMRTRKEQRILKQIDMESQEWVTSDNGVRYYSKWWILQTKGKARQLLRTLVELCGEGSALALVWTLRKQIFHGSESENFLDPWDILPHFKFIFLFSLPGRMHTENINTDFNQKWNALFIFSYFKCFFYVHMHILL